VSDQYYLRVRGRVLGPYDQAKLQSLAQRGQLGRMHEVSTDGAVWSRASAFPEIFSAKLPEGSALEVAGAATQPGEYALELEPVVTTATAAGQAAQQSIDAGPSAPQRDLSPNGMMNGPPPPRDSHSWHYMAGGRECGPVDFIQLQMLIGTGQLQSDDLVWAAGMPSWVPLNQVPGLQRASAGNRNEHSTSAANGHSEDLPQTVARAALSGRGWAMFVAIMAYFYAGLQSIAGVGMLVTGIRMETAPLLFGGCFWLINALIFLAAGILLTMHVSRLGGLRYQNQAVLLERALDSLRGFWILLSIYAIVMTSFLLLFFLGMLSAGYSWQSTGL